MSLISYSSLSLKTWMISRYYNIKSWNDEILGNNRYLCCELYFAASVNWNEGVKVDWFFGFWILIKLILF